MVLVDLAARETFIAWVSPRTPRQGVSARKYYATAAQRERRRRMVNALAHKTTYIMRERHTNCHLGAYAPTRIPLAY